MKFILAAILTVHLIFAPLAFSRDFSGVTVGRIKISNSSSVDDEEIRALLPLSEGQPYDPGKARYGMNLLSRKIEIRNVIIRGEEQNGLLYLDIVVEPEPLIQSIRLAGGPPVDKTALFSRLVARIDHPITNASLIHDVKVITEKFVEEGYPNAEVTPLLKPSSSGHWLNLTFQVNPGRPLLISSVEIRGDDDLDRSLLQKKSGLKPGVAASADALDAAVEKLKNFLWDKGWIEAKIVDSFFEPDGDKVKAVLRLEAGKPVELIIKGVGIFKKADFRALARRRFGRKVDAKWAQRLLSNFIEQLQTEGRYNAAGDYELKFEGEKALLVFALKPGPVVRVRSVEFEGNSGISSEELKKYLSALDGEWLWRRKFTREVLQNDLKSIADFYSTKGWPDAVATRKSLDIDEEGKASLKIKVVEGLKYVWGKTYFLLDGSIPLSEARKIANFRFGEPADLSAAVAAGKAIEKKLRNSGYPNAKVGMESESNPLTGKISLRYSVNGGAFITHGQTIVSGNTRTKNKIVRRELAFDEGDPWNSEAVSESVRNLYGLGFLNKVRIEPVEPHFDETVRDVQVSVEERDAGKFIMGFGYGTEEGVRASGSISHENFWGYGRSLGLRADLDELEQSYAVNFREPRLFNRRLNFGLSLIKSYQQQDIYTLSSTAFQTSVEKDLSKEAKARLVYTLESDELLGDEKGAVLVSAVGPVLAWDTRDDPFNPRKGDNHTVQVEWATDAIGSEVRYERYVGMMSKFFSSGNVTLALKARGGILFTLAQTPDIEDVLKNKLFYLGGRGTVRGFERNSIGPKKDGVPTGGDAMVNLKAELRLPLWKSLGGAIFWDAGNVWNRAEERPDMGDLRQAAGFGSRIETPVGPVAFDLGFKLDPKEGEDPYAWHFSIGNVF